MLIIQQNAPAQPVDGAEARSGWPDGLVWAKKMGEVRVLPLGRDTDGPIILSSYAAGRM